MVLFRFHVTVIVSLVENSNISEETTAMGVGFLHSKQRKRVAHTSPRFPYGNIVHRKFGLLKLYRGYSRPYFKTCHLALPTTNWNKPDNHRPILVPPCCSRKVCRLYIQRCIRIFCMWPRKEWKRCKWMFYDVLKIYFFFLSLKTNQPIAMYGNYFYRTHRVSNLLMLYSKKYTWCPWLLLPSFDRILKYFTRKNRK